MEKAETGILYVVALPIGNLKDITLRALEVLRNVDIILTEDTRSFKKLQRAYNLPPKELISFYKEVEKKKENFIIELLKQGKKIALCSEAGTPLISDPGSSLVRRAHIEGLKVEPIPGPSALTSTLSVSGIDLTRGFVFLGFLPKKKKEFYETLKKFPKDLPVVLFIPPHRFQVIIEELLKIFGNKKVFLAREITKIHQELRLTDLEELSKKGKLRGEITLLLEGEASLKEERKEDLYYIKRRFQELTLEGLKKKEIAKILGQEGGLSSKKIYKILKDLSLASD